MIRDKYMLLAGTVVIMIQVVWTPALWSITESGGYHWLLIRIPLLLSLPVGIGLFLAAIQDKGRARQAGLSEMEAGRYGLAVDALQNAIKDNPQDASLYRSQALALMFAGRDDEAKASLAKSLSLDPDNQLTQCIANILKDVANGTRTRPKSMAEI